MTFSLTGRAAAMSLGVAFVVVAMPEAGAWQLSPEATAAERGVAAVAGPLAKAINRGVFLGIPKIGKPVHEDITRRVLRCPIIEPNETRRATGCEPDTRDHEAGVRWNDDPGFKFLPGRGKYFGCRAGKTVRAVTQPWCWARVFRHGENAAARGVRLTGRNGNLLVRSHFGDLQFPHAMALEDGESPEQTWRAIMAWMEFTWRTATGDDGFESRRLVNELPIDGFAERFRYNPGWRIQDLFALDNTGAHRAKVIQRIAFGSLLHVVQDSFAAGHVDRAPPTPGATCAGWRALGEIREFHSYSRQDSHKHGLADTPAALHEHEASTSPNVIDVVRTLGILWRSQVPWEQARPYLACVFALAHDARPSSPGDGYMPDAPRSPNESGG